MKNNRDSFRILHVGCKEQQARLCTLGNMLRQSIVYNINRTKLTKPKLMQLSHFLCLFLAEFFKTAKMADTQF